MIKVQKRFFTSVRKRDCRIVPFNKGKIVEAVFKAARQGGGETWRMSHKIADNVEEYLKKNYLQGETLSMKAIGDAIEGVLMESGHPLTARAYNLHRIARQKMAEKLKVSKNKRKKTDITDFALLVATETEAELTPWNRDKISQALVKEANIPLEIANRVAHNVEKKIVASGLNQVVTGFIRELVDSELLELGYGKKIKEQTSLGIPTYDLQELIFSKSLENSNIASHNPEAVNLVIAETTLKQYALNNIFSRDLATAHMEGRIHIHDLGYPIRVYSFAKDEIVYIKEGEYGKDECLSLGALFNRSPFGYEENGFEIKPLKDFYIRDDDNRWTKLLRVVRHKANKKMLFIKTEDGCGIVVTEDHPMIDENLNQIAAREIVPGETKLITCYPSNILSNSDQIDLVAEFKRKGEADAIFLSRAYQGENSMAKDMKIKEANNCTYDESTIYINGSKNRIPAIFPLDEETGWLIGLFIAEGNFTTITRYKNGEYLGKDYLGCETTITCGEQEANKAKAILNRLKIEFGEEKKDNGCIAIRIYNKLFANFLREIFGIQHLSRLKCLPQHYRHYSKKFLKGMLAGIIDGDGSITGGGKEQANTRIDIRVSSKTLVTQIKHLTSVLGFDSLLRNVEGMGSERVYRGRVIKQNYPLYGVSFGVTQEVYDLLGSLSIKLQKIDFKPARKSLRSFQGASKVTNVVEVKIKDEYVYDVTTESGTFLCSGILTHNCSSHSLEYIKKYGLQMEKLEIISSPAKHARTLTGHLNTFLASMQAYYAGALGVGYINVFYAPYLVGMNPNDIKQEAQYLIFSLSQSAFSRGGQVLFLDANVHTGVPGYLKNVPAIGPGGEYTGKTYGDYEKEAQIFAKALMEVWQQGDSFGHIFAFPKMDLHINEDTFSDPKQYELLEYACLIASENGVPYFVFDRDDVTLSACCRLRTTITDDYVIKHPESMRFCGFQNVTINLPQAAYRAGRGRIEKLFPEIEKAMDLAMEAHLQKKRFIGSLMKEKGLPLWELGKIAQDGKAYVDLEKATYIIGIIGLNECVQYLTGKELHEDEEIYKLGLKIMSFMYLKAKEYEKKYHLRVALEESPAESAARRLAKVDLREYPESKEVIKGNIEKEEFYYTNSIHFSASAPMNLVDRIVKQSKFHTLIESGAIIHAFIGEEKPSPASIMNLVKKTWEKTKAAQLTISPEFTVCCKCNRLTRGLKEKCSHCGSTEVYGITRIVGYFSRTSNWNKSKLGELNDRHKGNYSLRGLKIESKSDEIKERYSSAPVPTPR